MVTKNTTRINCIVANNAEEFMSKMNKAFAEYDAKGISYTYETNIASGFVAYIFYQEVVDIPETAEEAFRKAGETHVCGECPYFERPADRRRKYVKCKVGNCLCSSDSGCCELLYQRLLNGEIELVNEVHINE